jgi:hypothetical protein
LLVTPSALSLLAALRALNKRTAAFHTSVADPAALNTPNQPPLLTAIETPRPRQPTSADSDQLRD